MWVYENLDPSFLYATPAELIRQICDLRVDCYTDKSDGLPLYPEHFSCTFEYRQLNKEIPRATLVDWTITLSSEARVPIETRLDQYNDISSSEA